MKKKGNDDFEETLCKNNTPKDGLHCHFLNPTCIVESFYGGFSLDPSILHFLVKVLASADSGSPRLGHHLCEQTMDQNSKPKHDLLSLV